MDIDNQVEYDDPQFVKVLETCLNMEITTAVERLEVNSMEIRRMKILMRTEIDKRKQLKEKTVQVERIRMLLSETLTRLHVSIRQTMDTLIIMKANADDQYKLMQLKLREYQDVVADYKKTWHAYRAIYEKFPLAKARNTSKINLEKLQIEHMVMKYKKAETMTIIKQKRYIDWIRLRCKLIEFANIMTERSKLKEKLLRLKANVDYHTRELRSIEMEMQVQRKKKEDQKKLRKQKMLEMAPPKIYIPYRQMYVQKQIYTRIQPQWKQVHESFDDTASVDTVVLEELCIDENTIAPPKKIDVELVQNNNPCTDTQMEICDFKNSVASEKINMCVTSVAPDVEANTDKADLNNDVEMKETHQKSQQSQESTKMHVHSCIKENLFKHNSIQAVKNTQDEIEMKKIRYQKKIDEANKDKIIAGESSTALENVNSKFPPPVPKIKKIETVHYDVTSIVPTLKFAHRSNNVTNNVSSPMLLDCCDSNTSAFDCTSKVSLSLYEDSLYNYKLSPNYATSPVCASENAQMNFSTKYTSQQSNKDQSDDKVSEKQENTVFHFNDFVMKEKGKFTLF